MIAVNKHTDHTKAFSGLSLGSVAPELSRRVSGDLVALVPYKRVNTPYWGCDCERCGSEVIIKASAIQEGRATACCDDSLRRGDLYLVLEGGEA